jgi:hypothetical protein
MAAEIVHLPSEKEIAELALKSAAASQVAEKAVATAEKIDAKLAAIPASRRANHYLRRQMIHGARSVMFRLAKHDDRRSQWLKGLAAILDVVVTESEADVQPNRVPDDRRRKLVRANKIAIRHPNLVMTKRSTLLPRARFGARAGRPPALPFKRCRSCRKHQRLRETHSFGAV